VPRAKIQVAMDDEDFSHLWHTAMEWARYAHGGDGGWAQQIRDGRFEVGGSADTWPSLGWKWAYWLGSDYAPVILAKAFLAAWGNDCDIVMDAGGSTEPEWVILTDYDWKQPESAEGSETP
jgi:hypothetical protein